ncbi:phosphoesterase [Paraburkholderia aspalathi]|nr:metallophosphoesterase [Paraburkholderia aspalathi]MBK3779859.1 phosphoesterase [Paraburkholderia aspalathi]
MKLHILSDLHLEHAPFTPPDTDADVVVLAGDIAVGDQGVRWAQSAFADKPVIYVPGNHEPYGYEMSVWRAGIEQAAREAQNVFLLNVGAVTFSRPGERPVRVMGATLWTDFAVFGKSRASSNARLVEQCLSDYRQIRVDGRALIWQDTLAWHEWELAWLKDECRAARARGEKVVVVTHHGPSLRSSHHRYLNDPITAGFLSNLEDFAAENVDTYIHGHVHNSSDFKLGNCRVVVNPRGYPFNPTDPQTNFENPHFNPGLVIEV